MFSALGTQRDPYPAQDHIQTLSVSLLHLQVTVQSGRVISLGIWDTAGAERFQSISRMYYHGSRAAIICFSPNSQQSFAKAKFWVRILNCLCALASMKLLEPVMHNTHYSCHASVHALQLRVTLCSGATAVWCLTVWFPVYDWLSNMLM